MPFYDYKCEECNYRTEHLMRLSDPPKTECPACGGHKYVKQVTAPAPPVFNGTGFYATDFK